MLEMSADSAVAVPATLSGLEKAAILLIALGPAQSADVLRYIPEEEAEALARAIAECNTATPEQLKSAFKEFENVVGSQRLTVNGGLDYARKVLVEAYGPKMGTRLMGQMSKTIRLDTITFENFREVDPQQLAKFIQDEHPQTIALILSNLEASQAAVLLSSLPAETRAEVATRMGDLDQISPEVVRNIASVIGQKLRYLGELSRESVGGVRAVANMFNRLDRNTCSQMLEAVEKDNPALFENIRRFMFVFRDLEDLDAAAIRTLIGRVDRSTLLLAMKGADESLRRKFLSTQSQRGAEMTAEELANLGPVKLKDVDAAQQQTITVARELEKEGLISLSGSANEEYVY